MAIVRSDYGPPEDARLTDLPPIYQKLHASSRGGRAIRALHRDCRGLEALLLEAEEADWAGYESRDAFIQHSFGRPVDVIDLALQGVLLFDLSEPVPLDKAIQAGAAQRMAEAKPLAEHGNGPGALNSRNRLDNIRSVSAKGGTSADYLAARIKRDHPDIAARVEAGEFGSMRAAAIEAGIVKVPSRIDRAKRAVEKLSGDEMQAFMAWLEARAN